MVEPSTEKGIENHGAQNAGWLPFAARATPLSQIRLAQYSRLDCVAGIRGVCVAGFKTGNRLVI